MNTYFVTACDETTMEPVVCREIDAPDFTAAVQRTHELAREFIAERPVRITSVVEQPKAEESFFRRGVASFRDAVGPECFRGEDFPSQVGNA